MVALAASASVRVTVGSASRYRHPRCRLVKDVGAGSEVQARVATARGAEPQAGFERDSAVLEEPFTGLVARAEGGAVKPGKEGRLGRVPDEHREALA